MSEQEDLVIVALGASAGGVQAFMRFFERVPADSGMAFVAILHLSPEHESHLAEILQTSSRIPVSTVPHGRVRVEPNHVYVVSPRASLTFDDGSLVQSESIRIEERRAPVDIFFRALAEAQGANAACVVLSGTGADGSMGLKRIKERGGICLAQDPDEAEHPDMPRNAINTALVDAVLPAAEMPARLVAYRNQLWSVRLPESPQSRDTPDERALHDVFTELRARTGHDFTNYKRATVMRRIERRLGVRQITDLAAYAAYIRQHPEEAQAALKDLLIRVTNFFRDADAFDRLQQEIIPRLFAGKAGQDHVRVWAAGCATGEEAYSLAMLLAEHASSAPETPGVQIFATDIDERAIAAGREGLYTINDAADVSPERLRRFFAKEGDAYRVRKELRELVLFAQHNLIKDPPFSHLDLVSCRNLLIYLNRTAQQRVMEVVHFALNPDGYLFLGASESAEGASDLFVPVDKEAHIYQSRGGPPRLTMPVPSISFARVTRINQASEPVPVVPRLRERLGAADLHQRLLERYAPPSVIVNEEYEIVHMTEGAARMLQVSGGEPTTSLVKMVRPELRLELRTALYQAGQHRTDVQARGLVVTLDRGRTVTVNLTVRPVVGDEDPARGYYLVLFEEASGVAAARADEPRPLSASEPAAQLEEELGRIKAQLRTTVEQHETQTEELKASNEELQAINEELRSATEELETSKEELQSLNEELRTVNQELKVKIEELTQASNDVQNLINSTDFGTVFLDRGGRIKLFTPRARDIFSLIQTDRGRPLQDIACHLVDVDLSADVERVLDRLERIEREVVTRDGRWHLMRVVPYRTAEDRIDGVVLSFLDITDRKHADERLAQSEARLRRALEVETVGVLFFAMDGTITDANDAFLRMSGFAREDVRSGRLRWEGLTTRDRQAEFTRALDELRQTGRAAPYELECLRPDGSRWWAIFAGTRLSDTEAATFVVDITDRQRAAEALQSADRRKNEFLAALAHELRNPLAPISAALEVLRLGGAGDARAEQAREVMQRQVTQMIRLVEDLLEVSRITLGKIELRREPIDLKTVLRTAIEASLPAIQAGRHVFSADIPEEPLPLHGDAVRLAQVFTNLLRNAAKYTADRGTITLKAVRQDGVATVTVTDNGMGIPPQALSRIFDMFIQGDMVPAGQFQTGLGIGLTLVRTLVEAHGGRVEATSEGAERGASFSVHLPLMSAAMAADEDRDRGALDFSQHRVVVVDDNQDAATSLGTLLSMMKADVRVAYTGPEALELIGTNRPTVAFVDLGMPGMDGFQVAREIRRRFPELPITVVALTGWGQPHAREAVLSAGFDHHVTKPATTARLKEILAAAPGTTSTPGMEASGTER